MVTDVQKHNHNLNKEKLKEIIETWGSDELWREKEKDSILIIW